MWHLPAFPLDSILLAITVSVEKMSNWNFLNPRTPVSTAPVWMPILMSTSLPVCARVSFFVVYSFSVKNVKNLYFWKKVFNPNWIQKVRVPPSGPVRKSDLLFWWSTKCAYVVAKAWRKNHNLIVSIIDRPILTQQEAWSGRLAIIELCILSRV